MASFFDEIARNNLRSMLLFVIFSALFVAILMAFAVFLGAGIALALILGAIIIVGYGIFSYFYGDKLVLKMSKAQIADPKQYSSLYSTIEGLASANQIPMPKVYIINDPSPNAFATGRSKKRASIAVTSGLLTMMDRHELQGVLAHEISHIIDNDIRLMMIAVVYAGAIGLFAAFIRMSLLFGGIGLGERRNGGIILLIALIVGILGPIFALLIRLAISRRREYMADANGARITRDPHSLANALKQIQSYTSKPAAQPVKHASEMTAPLYFSNPLRAQSITNLFSTHPPIQDRIDKLEHMY